MDNLCHTLVGLALAESGLGRRTPRGTVTLAVAANLPDVDALIYLASDGVTALAVRRGWTHGVVAMVVLPALLAVIVAWLDRAARRRAVRRHALAAANAGPPADLAVLFALAVVGGLSHSFFDWLNSYGVRLLMPLTGEWFYGDAAFIVDPWMWLALGLGVFFSARRRRAGARGVTRGAVRGRRDAAYETRPARVALAACVLYVTALVTSASAAARVVERAARAGGAPAARRVMAGPVPLTPFRRDVVRDLGDAYELGTFSWLPSPRYTRVTRTPSGAGTVFATAAARTADGRAFLSWSRFPVFRVVGDGATRVRITDARYERGPRAGWAAVDVFVGRDQ